MFTSSRRPLNNKVDGVPIEELTGELRSLARLSRKCGAEAKASLKRAQVRKRRPETTVIYPCPG